jgi:hypothetical protein
MVQILIVNLSGYMAPSEPLCDKMLEEVKSETESLLSTFKESFKVAPVPIST